MIGTSVGEYIFIRICILFFQYLPPASLLIIGLSFLVPFRLPRPLSVWFVYEAAFYIFVSLPLILYIQRATVHPELAPRERRRALLQRCLDSVTDPERYLLKWFLDSPAEEIKRENVKEFFRWAFLNKGEVESSDEEELEEYVCMMEKCLQRELAPGRGRAKCLRLTLDRIHVLPRSLSWYLIVFFVDAFTGCQFLYSSFRLYRPSPLSFFTSFPFRPLVLISPYEAPTQTLTYWHRPHTSKTKLPVLFLHGIGIGLYPYVKFLQEINGEDTTPEDGEIGIIAVEMMSISFRITGSALGKEDMCREIQRIVAFHGWDRFVLVAHSYGTVVATQLLHEPSLAPRIASVVLIDPVAFLLHMPDVAYNFTHRSPTHANEHQLWYFASKDPLVAHTLARRFFWSENVLWKEDILGHAVDDEDDEEGRGTTGDRPGTVVLGGRDLIVDTHFLGAWLVGHQPQLSSSHTPLRDGSPSPSDHDDPSNGLSFALDEEHLLASRSDARRSRSSSDERWKSLPWTGRGLELLWFEHLDHAQVFDWPRERRLVIDVVQEYCSRMEDREAVDVV